MDFEVKRCTRRCARSDRELKPGETFYSVLLPDGSDVRREDYSLEAWTEAPEQALGVWRSQMPDADTRKVDWAPSDVILHYHRQLQDKPEAADTLYVLTLLMIRRRLMRLEESEEDEQGREVMVLFCPKDENEYRVVVTHPAKERVELIQQELTELLFASSS